MQIDALPSPYGRTIEPPAPKDDFVGASTYPRMVKAAEIAAEPSVNAIEKMKESGVQQEELRKAREFAALLEGDVSQNLISVAADFDSTYPEFNGVFSQEAQTLTPFLRAPNIKPGDAQNLVLETLKGFSNRVTQKEKAENALTGRESLEELKHKNRMAELDALYNKKDDFEAVLQKNRVEIERMKSKLKFHFGQKGKEKNWELLRTQADALQSKIDEEKAMIEKVISDPNVSSRSKRSYIQRLGQLESTERILIKSVLDAAAGGSKIPEEPETDTDPDLADAPDYIKTGTNPSDPLAGEPGALPTAPPTKPPPKGGKAPTKADVAAALKKAGGDRAKAKAILKSQGFKIE